MKKSLRKVWLAIASIFCLQLIVSLAWAGPTRLDLFYIAKSENKNQVHYAITLDDKCTPLGNAPVYAYWLMLEKGPGVVEGLLDREQKVYGISVQQVAESFHVVRFTLNAMPDRLITVTTNLVNGACSAKATTLIAGQPAFINSIYLDVWAFGVKQITVYGVGLLSGTPIKEVLK